jgi:hypothetical protein
MASPAHFHVFSESKFARSRLIKGDNKEKIAGLWNFSAEASVLAGEDRTMGCECNASQIAEMAVENRFEIKDLRNHSPETLETLRGLLASGTGVRPDLKRPHFFELEGDTCVFYVYVSPVDGSVALLATWPRTADLEPQARCH